ncbi:MAG: hypothetical protein FWB75_00235 [Oscillospiraceae bacterium]|nr:hypothetical protein [Oscillospiraceae bacterium]
MVTKIESVKNTEMTNDEAAIAYPDHYFIIDQQSKEGSDEKFMVHFISKDEGALYDYLHDNNCCGKVVHKGINILRAELRRLEYLIGQR